MIRKKNNPEQPQSAGLSLGQTRSGTLLIGGSREFAGYDITPNVKLAKDIANVAVRILPVLKNTHIYSHLRRAPSIYAGRIADHR